MAERDGLLKRLGRGFDRYIGGLLGEDLESMTPQERANARRQVIGAFGRGMVDPEMGAGALGAVTQARAQQRAERELARRATAAEAEMPRITGRLFGGTAGAIESLPGGEGGPLTARYRQAPQEALARLYGTQAGRDVATMAPDLSKVATEGALGRTVGGAVYNPLTGGFTRPPEAAKPRVPVQEVNLNDRVIVYYNDGTTEEIPKGVAPRAGGAAALPRAAAAGGGAPGVAGAAGGRFQTLTAEETVAAGFPEGTVVQRDNSTGALKVLSAVPATQRTGEAGKETAVERAQAVVGRLTEQMGRVSTGGMLGLYGVASRIFDSQDAKLFESYRQQLSSALRTALRIPGEGALSDREQAQYGLQLPELGQSKENNLRIMDSLMEQVRLAAGQRPAAAAPAAPAAAPARPAGAPAAAPAAPQFIYRNGRLVPAQPR